jgi:uncharacterized protein YqeY
MRALLDDGTVIAMEPAQPAAPPSNPGATRDRLRRALPAAIKARDTAAVAALRSALAAIDNAEAADSAQAPPPTVSHAKVAGTVPGLHAAEVPRRTLTGAQIDAIVRAEITERHAAARDYEHAGRLDHAERLRAEAATLSTHLDGTDPPAAEPG